jgi:hypothetical protein
MMITLNVTADSNSPKLQRKLEKAVRKVLEAEKSETAENGTNRNVGMNYSVDSSFNTSGHRIRVIPRYFGNSNVDESV